MLDVLHVGQRDVAQSAEREMRIAGRFRQRATERRRQRVWIAGAHRGTRVQAGHVLDHTVDNPVAELTHELGLESERVPTGRRISASR